MARAECFHTSRGQPRSLERVEIPPRGNVRTPRHYAYRRRVPGRDGRTISPVGVRSVRRGVLRLSQYGVVRPAVVVGIVVLRRLWIRGRKPIELRARHRCQAEQQYLRNDRQNYATVARKFAREVR